jgi:hypothetical protein
MQGTIKTEVKISRLHSKRSRPVFVSYLFVFLLGRVGGRVRVSVTARVGGRGRVKGGGVFSLDERERKEAGR